jgi:hypothetical protein
LSVEEGNYQACPAALVPVPRGDALVGAGEDIARRTTQAHIRQLLGAEARLPDGEYPLPIQICTDAFMCLGAGW